MMTSFFISAKYFYLTCYLVLCFRKLVLVNCVVENIKIYLSKALHSRNFRQTHSEAAMTIVQLYPPDIATPMRCSLGHHTGPLGLLNLSCWRLEINSVKTYVPLEINKELNNKTVNK